MSDPKSLTVRALRELARKHLGKGHSRLKTKQELIDALKERVPDLLEAPVAAAGAKVKAATRAAKELPAKVVRFAKKKVERSLEVTEPGRRERPERGGQGLVLPRQARDERVGPRSPRAGRGAPTPEAGALDQHPAEPLVEGFFVAKVAGEDEARRHHLTEEQALVPTEYANGAAYREDLGELPLSYEDDAAVALPRDPTTLFVLWDFRADTRDAAARGLVHPRAVLRVFDGPVLIRQIDFALESRSFYVHGLPPGRRYRIEAAFVGADGESRRIGSPTNPVALPRGGPSNDLTVRFLRVPWSLPPALVKRSLEAGTLQLEERHEPRRRTASVEEEARPTPLGASLPFPPGGAPEAPGPRGWVPPVSGAGLRWAAPISGRP